MGAFPDVFSHINFAVFGARKSHATHFLFLNKYLTGSNVIMIILTKYPLMKIRCLPHKNDCGLPQKSDAVNRNSNPKHNNLYAFQFVFCIVNPKFIAFIKIE